MNLKMYQSTYNSSSKDLLNIKKLTEQREQRRRKLENLFNSTSFFNCIIIPYDVVRLLVSHILEEEDWLIIHTLYQVSQSLFLHDLILSLYSDISHYWGIYSLQYVMEQIDYSYLLSPEKQVAYYHTVKELEYRSLNECFANSLLNRLLNFRKKNRMYWIRNHHQSEEKKEFSKLEKYQDYRNRFIVILRNDFRRMRSGLIMGKDLIEMRKVKHQTENSQCRCCVKIRKIFGNEQIEKFDHITKQYQQRKLARSNKVDQKLSKEI